MKKSFIFLVILILFGSFTVLSPESEEDKALKAIHGFYEVMLEFQYDKMDDYCTADFSIIDNFKYYKSLDEFKELVRTYEGSKSTYKLDIHKADFNKKTGWFVLTFDIDVEANGEKMHITALENYVMKKEGGKWLLAFVHSTPVKK